MANPWLQLLRIPNMLTVPGDPLAGFLLNGGDIQRSAQSVTAAVLAGLAFYAGGLLLNDWFDREEDRRERPWRPLPSGRVAANVALGLGVVALAVGCVCAVWVGWSTGAIGAALTTGILAYNGGAKRHTLLGPILMGSCRGMNVLLGVAAAGRPWSATAASAALIVAVYVGAVSYVARGEAQVGAVGRKAWWPVLALLAAVLLLPLTTRLDTHFLLLRNGAGGFRIATTVVLVLFAMAAVLREATVLCQAVDPSQKWVAVGGWICALPLVQAALCSLAGEEGMLVAAVLTLGHVLCRWMGKKVNAS